MINETLQLIAKMDILESALLADPTYIENQLGTRNGIVSTAVTALSAARDDLKEALLRCQVAYLNVGREYPATQGTAQMLPDVTSILNDAIAKPLKSFSTLQTAHNNLAFVKGSSETLLSGYINTLNSTAWNTGPRPIHEPKGLKEIMNFAVATTTTPETSSYSGPYLG